MQEACGPGALQEPRDESPAFPPSSLAVVNFLLLSHQPECGSSAHPPHPRKSLVGLIAGSREQEAARGHPVPASSAGHRGPSSPVLTSASVAARLSAPEPHRAAPVSLIGTASLEHLTEMRHVYVCVRGGDQPGRLNHQIKGANPSRELQKRKTGEGVGGMGRGQGLTGTWSGKCIPSSCSESEGEAQGISNRDTGSRCPQHPQSRGSWKCWRLDKVRLLGGPLARVANTLLRCP